MIKNNSDAFSPYPFEENNFVPKDFTEEMKQVFAELSPDWAKTIPQIINRNYCSGLRLLLHRFVCTSAQKEEGTSYLSYQGVYLHGNNDWDRQKAMKVQPKDPEIGIRKEQMREYALAIDYGVQKSLEESGFIKNKDDNYQTLEEVYKAIELDSISKKGPFDGGDMDIALTVADNLLESAESPKILDDDVLAEYLNQLEIRRGELAEIIDPNFAPHAEDYLKMLANKGLRDTHRGAWSHSAGENAVNYATLCKYKYELEKAEPRFKQFFEGLKINISGSKVKEDESFEKWIQSHLSNVKKLFTLDSKVEQVQNKVYVNKGSKIPANSAILHDDKGDYYITTSEKRTEIYTAYGSEWQVNHYTHNFLLYELLKFMEDNSILLGDFINLGQCLECPISRDQGAPYDHEVKVEDGVTVIILKDRKGRKYRIVIPAPALAQAYIQLYTMNLIDNIQYARGRIGISDPDTNKRRMNDMIHFNNDHQGYCESIDFDTYDIRVNSQEQSAINHNLAALYTNDRVKDAFRVATYVMNFKGVLLPQFVNESGHHYDKVMHHPAKNVKGDPTKLREKYWKQMGKDDAIKFKQEADDNFQYKASWFFIWLSWLISGIILTNTDGSENTIAMARTFVSLMTCHSFFDKYLSQEDRIKIKEWLSQYKNGVAEVVGNGDDCCMSLPSFLLLKYGRPYVLEMIEDGFEFFFGAIVKKAKQIKICYKGYPVVEMLQHIYPQGPFAELQGTIDDYQKFLRQLPCMPYTERHSNRPLLQKLDSVEGRFDSCLCKQNVDFAAAVIGYAGMKLKQLYRKRGFYPVKLDPNSVSGFGYDPKYHPRNDWLLGLGQYFGLKKRYKNQLIPELTRLSVEVIMSGSEEYEDKLQKVRNLVDDFREDLETRAPHRQGIERIVFANVDDNIKEKLGILTTKDEYLQFSSLTAELVEKIEQHFNTLITPLDIPMSATNKVVGVNIDDGPEADGLE